MNLRTLVLGFALAVLAIAPASAQRGGGSWELLGEEKVGFGADRDVIAISNDENHYRNRAYRRLRLVVHGGEVKMRSIRLVYLNGHTEDLTFGQNLRPGQNFDVDLPGERSYLRQIELYYKSKFRISLGGGGIRLKQATIQVYGENVRGGRPPVERPRPGPIAGWNELDVQRFDRGESRVVMPVGRREGAVGQILLRADSTPILVRSIEIVYGNGRTQDVTLNQTLGYGERTRAIDLVGDRRFIQRVNVNLDGRRRSGQAVLALFGKDEPKPSYGGGNWTTIATERYPSRDDQVEFQVGRGDGRFGRIRLQAGQRDTIRITNVTVRFGNGQTQRIGVNQTISNGESTRPIDLEGNTRFIDRVVVNVDPPRSGRRGRDELVLLGSQRPGQGAGGGKPGFAPRAGWVELGSASVGFRVDRDVIRVNQTEDWHRRHGFDKLHFSAEGKDVQMISIRLTYLNGFAEDYQIDRVIPEGGSIAVDMRGRRSYIKEIEMLYRKQSGFFGRATVRVYGEPPRGRR